MRFDKKRKNVDACCIYIIWSNPKWAQQFLYNSLLRSCEKKKKSEVTAEAITFSLSR